MRFATEESRVWSDTAVSLPLGPNRAPVFCRTMAVIRPFRGLRFGNGAGELDALTAPPYDVISPAQRADYASRSAHNVVHLTLPEQRDDDRSKFVKYMRSAAALAEWRRNGTLVPESAPAIYRYTQSFSLPRIPNAFHRTKIIALIKTEPYEKGVVLPHEQTFPKHKEDRMRILEATRAHLECIFGLYEDPTGEVLTKVRNAPVAGEARAHSDEGVDHVLEPIVDEVAVAAIVHALADKKVWIADGHHRYETAVAFRENLGDKDGLVAEDFMMMALCSLSDPGLVLLPTHRALRGSGLSREDVIARLSPDFEIVDRPNVELMDAIEAKGKGSFGIAFAGGSGIVASPKNADALIASIESDGSLDLKSLDVTILHRVILERALGIAGLDKISYTRDPEEAVTWAEEGAISFLMTPPTVEDMKIIALGGEKMPQKSTYYFPKILSGLVMWSLNDF